jgi:hypothetical protein
MTNLTGQGGRDAMPTFTSSNFELTTTPEPSSLLLISFAGFAGVFRYALQRKRQ